MSMRERMALVDRIVKMVKDADPDTEYLVAVLDPADPLAMSIRNCTTPAIRGHLCRHLVQNLFPSAIDEREVVCSTCTWKWTCIAGCDETPEEPLECPNCGCDAGMYVTESKPKE